MPDITPSLDQLNIIVRDMDATVAFYRRLGLPIEAAAAAPHVAVHVEGGLLLEFDSADFVPQWDSGYRGATGGSTLVGFSLPSREAVDALHDSLVAAGSRSRQRPYDAFWGARYAIIEDPDGNGVGLMSPVADARKTWPPQPPPT